MLKWVAPWVLLVDLDEYQIKESSKNKIKVMRSECKELLSEHGKICNSIKIKDNTVIIPIDIQNKITELQNDIYQIMKKIEKLIPPRRKHD